MGYNTIKNNLQKKGKKKRNDEAVQVIPDYMNMNVEWDRK